MGQCVQMKEQTENRSVQKNGILGIAIHHYQTIFETFHEISGSFEERDGIVRKILCLSSETFELIKHEEFHWATESLRSIPSCPIEITDQTSPHNELQKGLLSLLSPSKMDLVQKGNYYSTAVLGERLKGAVFLVEYRIEKIKKKEGLVCYVAGFGSVLPSLCIFPKDSELGFIGGSACFNSTTFGAAVISARSRSSYLPSSFHHDSIVGKTVAVEADLREGKKTLCFSLDGTPVPAHVTDLPDELLFAVYLLNPSILTFVSFQRKGDGHAGILIGSEAVKWE